MLAPYYFDPEQFVKDAQKYKPEVIICHQTFTGSKYENGFFAPDGMDPARLGTPRVFSGHIHSAQALSWDGGIAHYIGSPRWRTMSDANVPKNVAIYDTELDTIRLINTSTWCSPILSYKIDNIADLESITPSPKSRIYLDLTVPTLEADALVSAAKSRFPTARIRVFKVDSTKVNYVSESEGVFNALRRFIDKCQVPYGTDRETLKTMISQRLHVNS
jgi:DNA repair exonuclease SbcCD nuclease subunit